MARRVRVIIAALGLCILFLILSPRKSGSHPRDLQAERFHDSPHEPLSRPIIKEPPGPWDPIQDKFKDQQKPGKGDIKGLDEQIDPIAKGALDLPENGIKRKTLKKGKQKMVTENGKEDTGPGVVSEKPPNGVGGSGGMVAIEKEEVVWKDYDPAEDLKVILTQAPITIFSKTYCPHSKDAKKILLVNHKIVPEPYVVELDKHPHGPELQAHLSEVTGRRTVPNILVNGESIGGGDEMRRLEADGNIAQTLLGRLQGRITVDGRKTP